MTEPESGGHVLGMTATAVRDGDDYILNGRKVYVGNSHVGDVHGVVVRTGPGSRGLTAFLVEPDRPGFSLGAERDTMGLHGFSFGELHFDNCRVPVESRLGEEGDGLAVAYSSSVLYGRANLTAVSLGIHRAILEETTRFCTERIRYGKPLYELPNIKIKLGQLQSRLMTARLAAYHAVHLLDQGLPCDAELMNAKVVNVESALDSARAAMEIHAAAGLFTTARSSGTCGTRTTSSPRPAPPTSSCCGWPKWRWARRRASGHSGSPTSSARRSSRRPTDRTATGGAAVRSRRPPGGGSARSARPPST